MTHHRARRRRLSSGSSSSPSSSSTEPNDLAIVSSSSRSLSPVVIARQRSVVVVMEDMSHQEDNIMIAGGVWKEQQGDEGSDTNISLTKESSNNEENSTQIDVDDDDNDDDSLSCASSCSSSDSSTDSDYYDAEPEDLKFRLTSSLFFLLGASIQTVTASWDVRDARMDAATAIAISATDDFTTSSSSEDDPADAMDRLYRILYSLGPFLFVLNALVEILHSLTLPNDHHHNNDNNNPQGYHYILRKGCLQWTTNMTTTTRRIPCTNCCAADPAYQPTTAQDAVAEEEEADLDNDNDRHQHHRHHHDAVVEDKLSDFVAAAFFGIGAMLELYGTFVEYDNVDSSTTAPSNNKFWTGYRVNIVSMHTYLISGLLTVHKERRLLCFPSSGNDNHYGRRRIGSSSMVRIVMGLGIMLFILGSVVDCVMSYLYDPMLVTENMISPLTLAWCNLSSTILWNVDAICYVVVDCLIFELTAKCSLWMRQLRPTQWQPRQRQRQRTATTTSASPSLSPPRHVELTTHLAMPLLLVGGGTAAAATIDTVSSPTMIKMEQQQQQQQQEHQLSSQKVV